MAIGEDERAARESRLFDLIGEYYAAIRGGEAPDLRVFLDRCPDLADELGAFFADQERFHRALEPLRQASRGTRDDRLAIGESSTPSSSGGDAPDDGRGGRPRDGAESPPSGGPGEDFGDYELLGEIARGGMGVVFKARHRKLDRLVALKMVLRGDLAAREDVQRARNEAEAIARLDHPHIIPIYEVGEFRGCSFFSMKLTEGGDLSRRLADFAADPRAAAGLIAPVARAVHHAHLRGILHRDLKPSNILLDEQGRPYVTDFGLAKRVEGDSGLTQSGAVLGTPSYMAPEQAAGRRGEVTTATDVYGLGAVLYAVLSGRPPFRGDSALETIERVREDPPEPPSSINRLVDRDLQTICLKCLEKDPRLRYESARELAEDLERWLRGDPILARRAGGPERLWRWCRRPARVAEAGGFAAFSSGLLIAWNLLGIALASAGVGIHAPRPRGFIGCCLLVIVLFYLPVALSGAGALRRKAWAPWTGALASLLTLLAMLFPILDSRFLDFGGFFSDYEKKLAVFSILCLLTGIQLLGFVIALVASRANRPPSRSPRSEARSDVAD